MCVVGDLLKYLCLSQAGIQIFVGGVPLQNITFLDQNTLTVFMPPANISGYYNLTV
jgi:hypothetical protein